MKTLWTVFLLFFVVFNFSVSVFAEGPTAVSPGSTSGDSIVGQTCPTFSWSEVEGAVAYRIEVFDMLTNERLPYEETGYMSEPVISKQIPAPALSWTPCYVWYVKGIYSDGEGEWSVGKGFEVDVTVAIEDMEEVVVKVVEKAVEEYMEKERAGGAEGEDIGIDVTMYYRAEPGSQEYQKLTPQKGDIS
jgi:hypothetical protein